jgi:signal transduction histidine kinase
VEKVSGDPPEEDDLADRLALAVHDLQEPLRAVAGMVGLLEQRYGGRLDAEADEIIRLAIHECERMARLVERVLATSQAGRAPLVVEDVDLAWSLDEVIGALAALVTDTGGVIAAGELPVVRADRVLVGQVLQNLVANALAFHRPGVAPLVHVDAERLDEGWRITVTDNGIGVAAPHRTRIFALFERLVPADTGGGAGLGLAVAERAVRRHGGHIGLDPVPLGSGSQFWFTLPD